MVKIKWTNKYSNETGFVKDIDNANKHFINTFEEANAKNFRSKINANTVISNLLAFGEGENNTFEVVSKSVSTKATR